MKPNLLPVLSIILISYFLCANIFAQDSLNIDEHDWDWEFDDFKEWADWSKKMPTISLQFGITGINHKSINDHFADANILELQLGHTIRKSSRYADNILKYSYKNLIISYISSDLYNGSANTNQLNSKSWQFCYNHSSGFGYKLGDAAIILFNSESFDWYTVDFTNPASNSEDQYLIDYIEDGIRFGTSADGGIKFAVTSLIAVDVSYRRSIVFNRHLFWKWAGSTIIEIAAQGALDIFIKKIFYSSPAAVPVVFFLLKNALSYGIYELRQEKMNWPFSSASPLSYDSFKFGVMFTF